MSWQLKQADRLVGTITFTERDMFWHQGSFEPGPAWPEFAPLFDALNDATERGDDEALHEADEAIGAAGFVLVPPGDGPVVTEFLLSIEDDAVAVRFP